MNTLSLYPQAFRKQYIKNIRNAGIESTPEKYNNFVLLTSIIVTVVVSTLLYFLNVEMYFAPVVFLFMLVVFYFYISLKAASRIKKMEELFPDVISLMASNLRSGITIDKAFLLAARPEFHPLDQEILKTGKNITTGQDIIFALRTMSERIDSEKIEKIILLIISGIKAGGNISDLLEQTAANMKKKEILEKKSRSTILMYVIFIFFAVGVGAPVLFGLSSILVEIIINLATKIPDAGALQIDVPFTFNQISISLNFIIYFSICFISASDLISSMVIGLVQKGDSKAGLRYFLPLWAASLIIFFVIRAFLSKVLLETIISF